ncbi:MAG: TetR/AcrR family transcriptional regulator [Myxococcota bacterium]|nr:TetR/AcrR family transcriptional regulator [Myxococcota bacterium]
MGKGADTRELIEHRALALASSVGLGGLTIGKLAADVGMSKSGVFAHFSSKENLHLAVLERYNNIYLYDIWGPALRAPRGRPRMEALLDRWLACLHSERLPGGCLFRATSSEFDDLDPPIRERMGALLREWEKGLHRAAHAAIDAGHFRSDIDIPQFIFETESLFQGYHHFKRLFALHDAEERLRRGFIGLLDRAGDPSIRQ